MYLPGMPRSLLLLVDTPKGLQRLRVRNLKLNSDMRYLKQLAREAESESVRLGAIKDLLDRAGLKPIERIETTTVEQMSDEEIRKEIDALTRH